MPATPKIGAGTVFKINGTIITRMMAITPAKVTIAKVPVEAFDNGTLGATGLPVEDSIPGWVSPGTYTVKLYFDKTLWTTILGLRGVAGTSFTLIKSDGSGYSFTGYISEAGDEVPLKEAMTADVTVTINGGTVATYSTAQT
jgi:hypothetical protein